MLTLDGARPPLPCWPGRDGVISMHLAVLLVREILHFVGHVLS